MLSSEKAAGKPKEERNKRIHMKPVNRNPPLSGRIPPGPPSTRRCHSQTAQLSWWAKHAHTGADNSRHASHVTLRKHTHTQTRRTLSLTSSCKAERQPSFRSVSCLPSEGSSAWMESASCGSLTFTVAQPLFRYPGSDPSSPSVPLETPKHTAVRTSCLTWSAVQTRKVKLH